MFEFDGEIMYSPLTYSEEQIKKKVKKAKNPTWWKRRTSMERCLTLLTAISTLIGISLVVALVTVLYNRNQEARTTFSAEALHSANPPAVVNAFTEEAKTCLTPGCIHTASTVLKYMDPSVDPCDDFYQFTCGNFLKTTNIPDDKSSVTSFSLISDTLQEQLRTMIEEPIKPDEPKPFQLTKKLYKACMNKTLIEKDGLKTIRTILRQLGGWPVLEGDDWSAGEFDWRRSVYRFRRMGYSVDYFIDFSVGIDLKNSTRRIIDLDQASLGLRREFLTKGFSDKLVNAYYEYMVDIAVLFGADKERAAEELKESLLFEMRLANISLPSEKRRNATALYNPMTIDELQRKFPSIPWVEYMNTLLAPDTQITHDEIVVVSVPKYLTDFEALISRTPKRVQANYVMWRAAASSVSYLTEDLRKRQLEYTTVVTGRTERESRWKECIDISAGSLSIAAGALYVRKYFNEQARQNALEMVSDIRAEFQDILKNVDWMDPETKKNALDKAKSMSTHIAYPDELLDDRKLEEFYGDLELDENYYLRSILNLTLFGTRFSFKRLRQPVNKTDWITHGRPAVVNAFYSALENSIQFPAGILQGVFFDANRPRYMNYGAIGFVIGHEITHGFDDQGRQFDKNGNLVEWWAPETKKAYLEKAQCIIDQYGNYTVPELNINLNGINTQGENIADNGGIKEAYLAYNKWTQRHGIEKTLPGLKYTPNQMFWISAANTWCAKYRPESLKLRVLTGYHSPGYFRVIGPFSNLDYFAKDFSCPLGSKMNPKKKCKVW
ncbi:neprilysin-2 isoform X2 [Tribolium castaneum]|uniref:neprilysin-2 isoform X2 n=1 Tax=Tribolium castaneum TaxID=7070 RepID=UPI00046BFB2F|nr:PREDICTED: neprilysin-11 isoform X2 [Tribolium castaneum]|eukprot:XP_008194096.1 PREDICTED: neprilysin-11 isoform X2 [Tribolium castaneum]